MLITMRLTFKSHDVAEAIDQTIDALGASLASAGEHEPAFEKISELAFSFGVAHPCMQPQGKGRASYSRESGVFFAGDNLDYDAWIGNNWEDRVRSVAKATQKALSSVHKTRLTSEERCTLTQLIESTAQKLIQSPPDHLSSLKPIYAHEDELGRMSSIGFQPPGAYMSASAGQRVVELQPSAIRAYLMKQNETVQAIQTVKLYKRHEGRLLYREAWIDGENVVEHAGVYGERGVRSLRAAFGPAKQREVVDSIVDEAISDGFKAIPEARLFSLLVSKEISGAGNKDDLRRRHALEDFLNEVTGWRGLGHCDGGSIGSGSMEVYCLVVDHKIAAKVIADELAASQFNDFAVSRVSQ